MEDEILDLVDANDQIIGTINRSRYDEMLEQELGYLRAGEVFIRNNKGQLWIPRRTMNKKIAPGGLDYSMGGHIGAGETYEQGVVREIEEELGLSLTPQDLKFITKFPPAASPYFRALYLYETDSVPNYNRDDFTEYYWLTPAELLEQLEAVEPAKDSLAQSVRYLLGN